MSTCKVFNLEEARQLMPVLRTLLQESNEDLSSTLEKISGANREYELAEAAVDAISDTTPVAQLRAARQRFQEAIEGLSQLQNAYLKQLNYWVGLIASHGVIIRDLQEGLLDFPATENGLNYLLCWRVDESDIAYWHLESDGFAGRKPLSTLSEFY